MDSQYKYDFLQLHAALTHFLPISYQGSLNQTSHTFTLLSIKYKNLWNSLLKFNYYTYILRHDWDIKNGHNKNLFFRRFMKNSQKLAEISRFFGRKKIRF